MLSIACPGIDASAAAAGEMRMVGIVPVHAVGFTFVFVMHSLRLRDLVMDG